MRPSVVLAIVGLLFFANNVRQAYAQEWLWELQPNQYQGVRPLVTKADREGNLIACGFITETLVIGSKTYNPLGESGAFIAKVDSTGTLLWFRMLVGTGATALSDCAVNPDGSIIVVGHFSKVLAIGDDTLMSGGSYDILIFALDKYGNPLWSRSESSPGSERAEYVAVNQSGACLITGRYYDSVAIIGIDTLAKESDDDLMNSFAAYYNQQGEIQWVVNIESSTADVSGPLLSRNADGILATFIDATFGVG